MHLRLLAAAAFGLAAVDAGPLRAQRPAEVEREIAAVAARLDSALARRDRAALEPLVAAPFTWIHASDGRVDTREVWLANAAQGMALSGQRSVRSVHGHTLAVYGGADGQGLHTAVRVARVRLRDTAGTRESWLRQTHVFVRGDDGAWRLASGQGTLMYEGPPLDPALHARYAGTYVIAPGRVLTLEWEDDALFATLPNGARAQIFLASPTEEAVRTLGAGHLRFTLGPDGRPVAAALVRGGREVWRATRTTP
jgi:ketosteroid isomerase-like protein